MDLREQGRPASARGLAISAAALLVTFQGCFSPDLSDAECLPCPDNVCPSGLACEQGRCVKPNSTATCPVDSSAATAGRAGMTSTATGGRDGQGGAIAGLAGAESGSGGDAGAPSDKLELTISIPDAMCTGRPVSAVATAEQGTGPYRFSVVQGTATLSPTGATGPEVAVTGVFTVAGDYPVTVRVEDATDAIADAHVTLHVVETPQVTTTTLGDVCPGELYAKSLTATGGDGKTYAWSSDLPAAAGLTLDGDKLEGPFSHDGTADTLDVTLTVTSGGCESEPKKLTLTEDSATSDRCPQISIAGGRVSLPAPCAQNPYSTSFNVKGGQPGSSGYTWKVVAPPGLTFDDETRTLSGSVTQAGSVSVQVAAGNRVVQQRFPIPEPRSACWLAYLAPAVGATRLNFFDPLLQNRRAFPSDPLAAAVLDFKFSPDGEFMAYRRGTGSADAQLAMVELATFDEQQFGFTGVTHYAWSADSQALAVGFDTAQGRFLGGVKVSLPPAGGTTTSYPPFASVAADVDTELVWFAGKSVAFLSSSDPTSRVVQTGPLGDGGFVLSARDLDSFDNAAYVKTAPDGVFAIPGPGQDHTIDFFPADDLSGVAHEAVRVAPSGRFTARARDGKLEIFRAIDDGELEAYPELEPPVGVPRNTAEHCDAFLGWADSRDRLACVHAADGAPPEIIVFDVAEDGTAALTNITVRGSYDYPSSGTPHLSRVFSPSGAQFAFVTDDHLYAAQVVPKGTGIDVDHLFTSTPDTADAVLVFSADDRLLLEQRGTSLYLFDLNDPTSLPYPLLAGAGQTFPAAPPCDESFLASAGSYCGEARTRASFMWSFDSKLVAMATAAGEIIIKDVSALPAIPDDVTATVDCGSDCRAGANFAFQP